MACQKIVGKGGVANFPCDHPNNDHEGPCYSASVMGTVAARQQWEYERSKVGPPPSVELPWTTVTGFQSGTRKPHPREMVPCLYCKTPVIFEEMEPHLRFCVEAQKVLAQRAQEMRGAVAQQGASLGVSDNIVSPSRPTTPTPPPYMPSQSHTGAIGATTAGSLAQHIATHPRRPPAEAPAPAPAPIEPSSFVGSFEAMDSLTGEQMVNDSLEERIRTALNLMSRESLSNTPDFLLAHFLLRCLEAWESTVNTRDAWYSQVQAEPER